MIVESPDNPVVPRGDVTFRPNETERYINAFQRLWRASRSETMRRLVRHAWVTHQKGDPIYDSVPPELELTEGPRT